MRAHSKSFLRSSILLFLLSSCPVVYGQTTVYCDSPPGGRISCERHQAAICKISGGHVVGVCSTPTGATFDERRAWLISLITGREVNVDELTGNQEYQRILREGGGQWGGEKITFTLPDDGSDSSRNPPSDPKRERANLYNRWFENYRGDPVKQKLAYETGKEFLSKYGTRNDEYVKAVQQWVTKYEAAAREYYERERMDLYRRWRENLVGDPVKQKLAYEAAKEFLRKYGNQGDDYVKAVQQWVTRYEAAIREYENFKPKP